MVGGGRVIVENTDKKHYVMYGHLDHKHLPQVKQQVAVGDEIGKIGDSSENGGWFQHLHLQYMTADYVQPYIDSNKLQDLDGYAPQLASRVLDPMTL
jgi:murein DD-endopeptidase MepM/ murein hydrolase activator NlpD